MPAVVTARIVKQFSREDCDNGVYRVEVSKSVTTHHHNIAQSLYRRYAENLKVVDPSLLGLAKSLYEGGSSVKRILQFLKTRSDKIIVSGDVHNIVQTFKLEEGRVPLTLE
ncbi:hypothetical protein F444_09518 [Phytophthora nicotianae P1976]|uniref:Uncharacterized protein n=1 Tax=Phytophthora nicotianae P1976 TaxID=1317066 RepID=A0A081A7H5_PHYNI|nr:hypothetical protein F444_09518 [Phytophthora nicotianae P1976]